MKIQISSGRGPAECELAVGKFLEVLKKEFKDIKILNEVRGQSKNCYKAVIVSIGIDKIDFEGSIKWIAKSPFRPKHKRKNWYIHVSVVCEMKRLEFDRDKVRFETFRSGGSGGQNVNKVETGVRAIHIDTGIFVVSTEKRTQYLNKKIALIRLQETINQRNYKSEQIEKESNWLQHEMLERGNSIRVYKGIDFKRIQ